MLSLLFLFCLFAVIWGPYQITMATIFRTASFKLWQKFTNALPFGPILPSIIPELKGRMIITQEKNIILILQSVLFWLVPWPKHTHSCRENNNSQDVHAFTGTRGSFHYDIRRWREVQREVLNVCAVVVLDAINVDPACGGLIQSLGNCWLGDEFCNSVRSILKAKRRYYEQEARKTCTLTHAKLHYKCDCLHFSICVGIWNWNCLHYIQ